MNGNLHARGQGSRLFPLTFAAEMCRASSAR